MGFTNSLNIGSDQAFEYVGQVFADEVFFANRGTTNQEIFNSHRPIPHFGFAGAFHSTANLIAYLRYEQQFFAQLQREDGVKKLVWYSHADDGIFVADYDPTGESGNAEQRPVGSLEIAASVPVPDSILNETAVDVDAFEQKSTEIRWHDPPVIARCSGH